MATSFNLQEYILFRTEIKRELTNSEVDTNFKMVANPWEDTRIYEIGNIVYHPVIVDDPLTTGEDQVLAWWRANIRTTQGVFNTAQWDMIGGIGSGNINIQGANSFGKINVNSTVAPGSLQAGSDAVVTSTTPNDTFNFIAGQGMQLQYNLASKSIVLINTLAANPGEVNVGENIGTGTGHQDVYAGKVGLNLQFNGFQSTNTGAGDALSISTNSTQKNIEYNFNEGLVDLAQLNSGAPLIGMLSNVSANTPNAQDILQWNDSNAAWTPIPLSSLGQVNIYGNDGTIGSANRLVSLNGTAGQLQFNRINDVTAGIHFDNTASTHQLNVRATSATSTAAIAYSLNSIVRATAGIYGTDDSFGINIGATGLAGLSVDALSISTNNELFIPQIATDTVTAASVNFRIPFVNEGTVVTGNTALDKGKFESTNNYRLSSYSDQGGAVDMVSILHEGDYSFKGVSPLGATLATSFSFDNEHDFAANTNLTDGYGILMSYKTPTNKEADTIINHMDKTSRRFVGYNFAAVNSTMPSGSTVNKYLGSNITLDDMAASTPPIINVGSIINFSDTTAGAGVQPQRVGVYSNVVSSYTGAGSQDGEQVLTQLIADSGSWAGYFVGCVNIDQGGLVLPSTSFANRPLCNDVSGGNVSDRTLWINSANGHLYRGTVDIEASGGGGGGSSTLAGLSDVTLVDPLNDQLLVYNITTGQWENASLAAYNLNAINLTSGGVSIQLSDGAATSDVDLLPGTNITFSVNETTDEITINAANPPQAINIGNTDLYITEPRTLDFYDSQNAANNPLTFIDSNDSSKTLFKFEQVDVGKTPQLTIGSSAANGEARFILAGNGTNRTGVLYFNNPDGTTYTSFKAPSTLATNINYTLPTTIGTQNQVLEIISVAGGTTAELGWATPSGGGGSIGATGFIGATGVGATGSQGNAGKIGATGIGEEGPTGATGVGATGFTGSTGSAGEPGNEGATGAIGLTGATGDRGGKGDTGASGFTGSTGATGISGSGGATGITGFQGATGADGAIGQQGATGGQGATGADGAIGQQGATGEIGKQGAIGNQGATGAIGLQGATGADGAIGQQGATGADGAIGQQGATGDKGENGAVGQQGSTGAIGLQGATGGQGADGAIGQQGATGANGAIGQQGATGDKGEEGAIGNQGATGAIGLQGATGGQGAGGAIGQQGATGADGAIGQQGATGDKGEEGALGNQGATGAIGLQGATGADGAIGQQGATGEIGKQGAIGLQGATGGAGPSGIKGATGSAGPQGGSGVGFIGATGTEGATGAIGDVGGFTTTYNAVAVSSSTFALKTATTSGSSWLISGANHRFSGQGADPSSGTALDYDVTQTVYANMKASLIGGDQVFYRVWEYGQPEKVNFYKSKSSALIVTTGLTGGLFVSKAQYLGGAQIEFFNKPCIGWGFNGDVGFTGATGAGTTGAQGSTGLAGVGFIGATGTDGATGAIGATGAGTSDGYIIAQSSIKGRSNAPYTAGSGYAYGYSNSTSVLDPASYTGEGNLLATQNTTSFSIAKVGAFNQFGVTRSNQRKLRLTANATLMASKSAQPLVNRTLHWIVLRATVPGANTPFTTATFATSTAGSGTQTNAPFTISTTNGHNFQIDVEFATVAFDRHDLVAVGVAFSQISGDLDPGEWNWTSTWKLTDEGIAT